MGCVQSFLKTDADIEQLYTLDKCIGEGVEGQVYLAHAVDSNEQVAIKLVARGEDLGLGPEKVRREIQLQARLSHVNIVELKQVILTRSHLAIVLSFEGGGDLHSYCSKYTLNEEVARYFFRQIVQGLDYCHRHHVAHRDLKLGNFLLSTDKPMRVKLCDFGCARHWETKKVPEKRLGRFNTFAGTPAYMSPQVLQSAFYPTNTYDAVEADVWALGIVLTHMFFGKHTPFWLEANTFRNEASTMYARIEAMKQQNWVDSDEFVKANVTALSPELRDLLDKIFVADEFKRITMQGIMEHPWYTMELSPFMQNALDEMAKEQAQRDSLQRATVSVAANRHDTATPGTGEFATIDLLVDLAQKHRKMPGGSEEHIFCLDMAHMELGPLSHADSVTESIMASSSVHMTAAAAAAPDNKGSGADVSHHGSSRRSFALGRTTSVVEGDELGEAADEGTQHSSLSYCSSALDRVAQQGDRSYHYSTTGGDRSYHYSPGGDDSGASPAAAAAAATALPARFKRTLSLKKSATGVMVGSYVLQPWTPGSPGSSGGGGGGGAGLLAAQKGSRSAHSVHGGIAFFNKAAGSTTEGSIGKAAPVQYVSKTVHGGTEWAVDRQAPDQNGGIFYKG